MEARKTVKPFAPELRERAVRRCASTVLPRRVVWEADGAALGRPSPIFGMGSGCRTWSLTGETTMTDERMAPLELVERDADGGLVREVLAFAAERPMERKVEAAAGAAKSLPRACPGPAPGLTRACPDRPDPGASARR